MAFLVENALADDAVRRNVGAGYHYFDRDTLRFFRSKVHEGYDYGDGRTLVVMSNRGPSGIVGGRRHYYLVIVEADGKTNNSDFPPEFKYSVCDKTGYWISLSAARNAVKRLRHNNLRIGADVAGKVGA